MNINAVRISSGMCMCETKDNANNSVSFKNLNVNSATFERIFEARKCQEQILPVDNAFRALDNLFSKLHGVLLLQGNKFKLMMQDKLPDKGDNVEMFEANYTRSTEACISESSDGVKTALEELIVNVLSNSNINTETNFNPMEYFGINKLIERADSQYFPEGYIEGLRAKSLENNVV